MAKDTVIQRCMSSERLIKAAVSVLKEAKRFLSYESIREENLIDRIEIAIAGLEKQS